jgi:hypothetical protein
MQEKQQADRNGGNVADGSIQASFRGKKAGKADAGGKRQRKIIG